MVFNFEDALLYSIFRPQLVILNKATKAIKPNMYNILGNYLQISLVMVGNKAQLSPVALSDSKTNSFSSLLQMLFQQLKLLSQPSVLLNKQY